MKSGKRGSGGPGDRCVFLHPHARLQTSPFQLYETTGGNSALLKDYRYKKADSDFVSKPCIRKMTAIMLWTVEGKRMDGAAVLSKSSHQAMHL